MDLFLKDKIILVTGGAKGIGAAIVRACAEENALPVIVDKDGASAEKLQNSLRESGFESALYETELTNPDASKSAVEFTLQKFGRIDALVNNAGVNDGIGLANGTPEKFLTSLERNLHHYYYMAHFALAALKQSKGAIVNVSSKTALTGQGNTSGYVAAKAAILGLTREWAAELLDAGVRVNAVIPAEVLTPLYEDWLAKFPSPQEARSRIEAKIPLGKRMTTAEEIASTVLFLLSEKSSHTTGQHIFVDGGYTHLDRALT
jgi:L-fucose dehydrogenase